MDRDPPAGDDDALYSFFLPQGLGLGINDGDEPPNNSSKPSAASAPASPAPRVALLKLAEKDQNEAPSTPPPPPPPALASASAGQYALASGLFTDSTFRTTSAALPFFGVASPFSAFGSPSAKKSNSSSTVVDDSVTTTSVLSSLNWMSSSSTLSTETAEIKNISLVAPGSAVSDATKIAIKSNLNADVEAFVPKQYLENYGETRSVRSNRRGKPSNKGSRGRGDHAQSTFRKGQRFKEASSQPTYASRVSADRSEQPNPPQHNNSNNKWKARTITVTSSNQQNVSSPSLNNAMRRNSDHSVNKGRGGHWNAKERIWKPIPRSEEESLLNNHDDSNMREILDQNHPQKGQKAAETSPSEGLPELSHPEEDGHEEEGERVSRYSEVTSEDNAHSDHHDDDQYEESVDGVSAERDSHEHVSVTESSIAHEEYHDHEDDMHEDFHEDLHDDDLEEDDEEEVLDDNHDDLEESPSREDDSVTHDFETESVGETADDLSLIHENESESPAIDLSEIQAHHIDESFNNPQLALPNESNSLPQLNVDDLAAKKNRLNSLSRLAPSTASPSKPPKSGASNGAKKSSQQESKAKSRGSHKDSKKHQSPLAPKNLQRKTSDKENLINTNIEPEIPTATPSPVRASPRKSLFKSFSGLFEVMMAFMFQIVIVFSRLHSRALNALIANHNVLFCFTFTILFPSVAKSLAGWTTHWLPHCLWYTFLIHSFCRDGPPLFVTMCRIIVPLAFVTGGIQYDCLLFELNAAERIVIAFVICGFQNQEYGRAVYLQCLAVEILLAMSYGSSFAVQWLLLILSLAVIHDEIGNPKNSFDWSLGKHTGILSDSSLPSISKENLDYLLNNDVSSSSSGPRIPVSSSVPRNRRHIKNRKVRM